MKKISKYFALGVFFNGISIISTRFSLLPDFVDGLCIGLGMAFILMGIISSKYDISKFRNQKKSFIKKAFGK